MYICIYVYMYICMYVWVTYNFITFLYPISEYRATLFRRCQYSPNIILLSGQKCWDLSNGPFNNLGIQTLIHDFKVTYFLPITQTNNK